MIFSSGVPLPRPDRHSQKIYLARLGLSAKRLSSFLALAGRAAVSRLEAVFSLEVQSRCDRRRGRVVACRFCGRALPSRHVRSSSSLLPFSAPFSSHLVSSRLVSSRQPIHLETGSRLETLGIRGEPRDVHVALGTDASTEQEKSRRIQLDRDVSE